MNEKLFEFIADSPTAYHAAEAVAERLRSDGFAELFESEAWSISAGGKYFVRRNSSSLIAFKIPASGVSSFMITASHCDSPSFKIKENAELPDGHLVRLSCERYGGMLCSTWLDRPLSIAGRVAVRTADGIEERTADLKKTAALIPSVPPHLKPGNGTSVTCDPAVDMLPVYRCSDSDTGGTFPDDIAEAAGCRKEDILASDMFLYNPEKGSQWHGLISAPRLDDLQCAFASLVAFCGSAEGGAVPVYCLFDNEEVGSTTKQGAASTFLYDTLTRLCRASGLDSDGYLRAVADSFMVSCDNAHAVHPNHPELYDKNHSVYMNKGVVIKSNAAQRYTTDAVSAGIFRLICEESGVPVQWYANRADIAGGSTLGSIANTAVSLNTVDIGLAQLAMHSALETAGAEDTAYLAGALKSFFERKIIREKGGYKLI